MNQIWFGIVMRDFAWITAWQVVQNQRDRVLFRLITTEELTRNASPHSWPSCAPGSAT
jgi:hypothetical protein